MKERVPKDDKSDAPSFDLMVLGRRRRRHTASLFPGEDAVDERDRFVVHVAVAKQEPFVPRLSITAPVIEAARAIVVVTMGRSKNAPLERAWLVAGSTHDTPARILREARGSIAWVIDRAAGGLD